MRIAQFNRTMSEDNRGGAETMMVNLSKELYDRGHEVEIWSFGMPWIEEMCMDIGMEYVGLPVVNKKRHIFQLFFHMRKLVEKRNIDVFHSHILGGILRSGLSLVGKVPHIGTLHDSHLMAENPKRSKLLKYLACTGLKYVAVSDDIKKYAINSVGIKESFVDVIYNGIDVSLYDKAEAADDISHISNSGVVITCVSGMRKVKRLDLLIDALSLMKESSCQLVIVGDGPERRALEERVVFKGVKDKVHFLGFRRDIPSVLKSSDIFALSSESEGLSCAIQEAMASGLPVVASDVGGNNLLVKHAENGFLSLFGDVQEFAKNLDFLAKELRYRREMGNRSKQIIERNYSMKAMADAYEDLYNSKV